MRIYRLTPFALLSLLLILMAAAFVRFSYPGTVEFKHDEATLSLLALDWLHGGAFPVTGMPSSVGIPNAPASVYVIALPFGLGLDALGATLFIAALNVAGVGLLWWLAYRYIGFAPALIAGLIYALNPWAILYSRKIWAQDFHTPLLLLALMLGLLGFWERKRWAQVLCLPVFLFALQIHFAGWVLLPLYGWLLLTSGRRISPLALMVSALLGIGVLIPFGLGIQQTMESEPERITNVLNRSGSDDGLSLSPDALVYTLALSTGTGIENEVAAPQFEPSLPRLTEIWITLIGGAAIIGLIAVWWRDWRLAGLVWLWAALPLLAFTPQWTAIYPHYFIASIPAYALLVGIGVGVPFAQIKSLRFIRGAVIALFCLLPLSQGLYWYELIAYLDTTYTPGGFGPPLADLLAARDALTGEDDVVILSDGFERLYDQEPVIWSVLLDSRADCVRTLDGNDSKALFPAGAFAVLTAPNAPENPVGGLYGAGQPEIYQLRPGEGDYTLHRFAAAPAWDGPVLAQIAPLRFDNGAQLTGYYLSGNQVYLDWKLSGPVDADYQFFVHLLDASGERIAQQDSRFWPGRFWCAGDRLITWTAMEIPAGTETLRVGLYRLVNGGFVNSNLLDSAGNVLNPWADIPLN